VEPITFLLIILSNLYIMKFKYIKHNCKYHSRKKPGGDLFILHSLRGGTIFIKMIVILSDFTP